MESIIKALGESVRRNLSDGLLLSGGLETTIIAYLASRWSKPGCITVALTGAPAPDINYAKLVASRLGLKHHVHYFGDDEVNEATRAVIRIMKSFDPMEIRNSVAIYIGLKVAKDQGMSTIMTGDGGDELFAGYSFLFGLSKKQLDSALKRLWANMSFSSIYLANDLGIEVRLPYLDPAFKEQAIALDSGLKVKSEGGQVWGKWVLRKAFENIIPPEIAWRVKAPIEVGSGTTIFPQLYDSRLSDIEFAEKKQKYLNQDGVVIRSKEHLFYYEIYREIIGVPHKREGKACPDCGSSVKRGVSFCRTCGAYPI